MTTGRRWSGLAVVTGLALAATGGAPAAGAPACTAEQMAALRAPATEREFRVELGCSVRLEPGDVIEKEIAIRGGARDLTLDCNGARLGAPERGGKARETHRLVIESEMDAATGAWLTPGGITVRGCAIAGTMRIAGMGEDAARVSSHQAGHTTRAQAAAPHGIRIEASRFIGAAGLFKLFFNVGVTDVLVTGSTFEGSTIGTTIYVGDETARIHISDNRFDGVAQRREQIALDGAADSVITGNVFRDTAMGGVFIYRNCGERGRVRVQEPRRNRIEGNVFGNGGRARSGRPVVWLGSRNGKRTERAEQCVLDDGLGFGSSLPAGQAMIEEDRARQNRVIGNRFVDVPAGERVRDDDRDNEVRDNEAIPSLPPR